MSANVQAKLGFDVSGFRSNIATADGDWGRFKANVTSSGQSMTASIAPVAKGVLALGAAATAAGVAGGAMLGNWVSEGVALNSELESARNTFKAFTGDAKQAEAIVADLKKQGDESPLFSTGDMIGAGKSLITVAKGSREELMKLIKTSELLGALNPEQGLEGGAFALKEAISGDYTSLIERFNISRSMVKDLKAQGKEGLDLVQTALKQMGVNTDLITNQASSWTGLQAQMGSYFDNLKLELGQPVFEELKVGLQSFAEEMAGGSGQDVQEWAREIGQSLGKNTKEIVENLKAIDWKSMLENAKGFAEFLGNAAEAASKAVQFGSSVVETAKNGGDKLEAGAQRLKGFGNTVAANWWEMNGLDDAAAESRAAAGKNFEEAQRRDDSVTQRKLAKDKAYQQEISDLNKPIDPADIAKSMDKTVGQLTPEQLANRQRNLAARGQAQQGAKVTVTMQERSPMHSVMAT